MRIGIDLGGTKIEGLILDEAGSERNRKRVDTPRGDYAATLLAVSSLVTDLEHDLATPASIGVGTPGVISPTTGLMKNANSYWLNGKPLGEDLSQQLGRPVRLANDANCFALSEATDGAGAGYPVVFGVILGTGTGSGVVVHGRVLVGPNAVAGEWGHNPLPWARSGEWPGRECYCGRTGCVETFLSGPGFAQDHREQTGADLAPDEIAQAAASGDAACRLSLDRYVDRLARGLSAVINVLDPDVIVLGGGMSNLAELYLAVPEQWTEHVFSDRVDTPLLPPAHGDSSGVRGAAWLWGRDEV